MRNAVLTMALAVLQALACGLRTGSGGDTEDASGSDGSTGTAGSGDETGATSTSGSSTSGGSTSASSSGGSTSGGTTGTSSASGGTDTSQTSTSVDVCEVIDGTTYQSLEVMECGLGPDGPVYCHWSISFAGGSWEWFHSDVVESGSYSCEGNLIQGGDYSGELDTSAGILTWEGAEYEPL